MHDVKPALMHAATLAEPGRMEVDLVPRPEPAAREVLIRLEGCGVCASNLEPWSGNPWTAYPGEPGGLGHEGWGRIAAVGDEVTTLRPGQRVAALSFHSYAEYDVAPVTAIAVLPDALDDAPVPAEALGCAFNIFRRAGIREGEAVAIVGIGFLGAILTRLAASAGARVIAVSRRQDSRDLAADFGATETLPADDHGAVVARVEELTGGALCERVIECTGFQQPLDLAGKLTGFGGRLVIAGYHQDGPRQVDMQMWNWKGIDVINAHERDQAVQLRGVREGIAAAADGKIDLARLVTHRYPLGKLGEALDATRDKPDGFVKAWVDLS